MMNDLKRGLKLLGYSFQFRLSVAAAAIIEVFGLVIVGMFIYFSVHLPAEEYTSNALFWVSGIMLLQLAPLMLAQMAISLECSGIILSSPFRRAVGVSLPDWICIADAVQTVVCLAAIAVICRNTMVLGGLIFIAGFIFLIVLAYMTLAFRYLIAGIILYLVGYVAATVLASHVCYRITEEGALFNGTTGMALGILTMAAGLVVSAVMRRCLYKKPVAKGSVNKKLRQYM